MPPLDTPLTSLPLAAALYDAGLAPSGVFLRGWTYWYPKTLQGKAAWEPWCCIGDVWHLVLTYRLRIELDYCDQGTWVWHEQHYERASGDDDIAAAIGRLSLRLRQDELTQEAQHDPRHIS